MNRTLGILCLHRPPFRPSGRPDPRRFAAAVPRHGLSDQPGVSFTRYPGFPELAGLADISLCEVSYQAMGWDKAGQVPGLAPRMFTNQARHRALIDRCDRYISL
jgi:hypothetical protein